MAGSGARIWAHLRPWVLNAFDPATTATAWSAVPSSGQVGDVGRRALEDQRRVDLVGDDASAVASYDVADPLELAPGEDPAPRVVRLGEQQGAGAVGEQPVEGVEVDLGALGVRVDDQVDPLRPVISAIESCGV